MTDKPHFPVFPAYILTHTHTHMFDHMHCTPMRVKMQAELCASWLMTDMWLLCGLRFTSKLHSAVIKALCSALLITHSHQTAAGPSGLPERHASMPLIKATDSARANP